MNKYTEKDVKALKRMNLPELKATGEALELRRAIELANQRLESQAKSVGADAIVGYMSETPKWRYGKWEVLYKGFAAQRPKGTLK